MYKIILFGGTAEGRQIAEVLSARRIPSLVCVATEYGEQVMSCEAPVEVSIGRLGEERMNEVIGSPDTLLVIDATHPYATHISSSVRETCERHGKRCLRVVREESSADGCEVFTDMAGMIRWLNTTEGVIFSSLGTKEAADLTAVDGYKERVWLRILPSLSSLQNCLDLGYPAAHIYCMQGPFSREFNAAQFAAAGASVLITKESGRAGGFEEKVLAAFDNHMKVGVLARPSQEEGCSAADALKAIDEVLDI